MAESVRSRITRLVRERGLIRARDLGDLDGARVHLRRLVEDGTLANPTRGLYVFAGAKPGLNQNLIEVCARVPHGVVCLLSALQFHGLTTQAPFEVWLAIGTSARQPALEHPPLRIVRFSGAALTFGVEEHAIKGTKVRVFSVAKTVADCFKHRNKIGLDVALEALRDCWRKRRATMDDLHRAAVVCRMSRVMRPYLESLT